MKTRLKVKDYRGTIIEILIPNYIKSDEINVSSSFEIEKEEIVCETNSINIVEKK
ncbi:hypothetical protein HF846_04165 [Clostridium cadaveris]|uniref:hypothetical protein n=1 Tax=Clostridium cadaveris TaxID=1529 RepID=UPI001459ADA3|nr:hypothetical protein [Clostridium cadaveris]NME63795.1 hypothetical protein [Clostridium cadaveris]